MLAVILAGGIGSRLTEETVLKPKPLVEIGGRPILWHIMQIYSSYDLNEFVIALGYKGELIKDYFLNFRALNNDFSLELSSGLLRTHSKNEPNWTIHLVDTGANTQTGGRLKRLRNWIGDKTFMMTYGDGVAAIDLRRLLAFHYKHKKLATITAVRPASRFGGLVFDNDRVIEFTEKPQVGEGWINGGFFVLEPGIFDYIEDDATLWEREPLENLAKDGQLMAYKHDGFWQCMDTQREKEILERHWNAGRAPWKVWEP